MNVKNHKKETYRNRKNKVRKVKRNKVRNVKRKKFFLPFHWREKRKKDFYKRGRNREK